jgi:hypothetical protein
MDSFWAGQYNRHLPHVLTVIRKLTKAEILLLSPYLLGFMRILAKGICPFGREKVRLDELPGAFCIYRSCF